LLPPLSHLVWCPTKKPLTIRNSDSFFIGWERKGLDRLNRLGVKFVFDGAARQFHYDGAAWREILARHPRGPEAAEARRRLGSPNASTK
jgi:hypothetical protein